MVGSGCCGERHCAVGGGAIKSSTVEGCTLVGSAGYEGGKYGAIKGALLWAVLQAAALLKTELVGAALWQHC